MRSPSGLQLLQSSPPFQSHGTAPWRPLIGFRPLRRFRSGAVRVRLPRLTPRHPRGFLTLTAPIFRPGPPGFVSPRSAHGVFPFRACTFRGALEPLGPCLPPWCLRPDRERPGRLTFEVLIPAESRHPPCAFSATSGRCPHGVVPLQGLSFRSPRPFGPAPPRAFRTWVPFGTVGPVAPRGNQPEDRIVLSGDPRPS